jgi:hypothetical protein
MAMPCVLPSTRRWRTGVGMVKEVADWVEHYRRFWEQRFDRLDTYLHELQRKEKKHGRKR